MMKLREAELAAAEAERAKAEAEKEAQERTKREAEEKARKEAEERAKQEAEKEAAKAQAPKPSEEVPSIFSNKPLFPPVQTSTSSAPSKKPFVFEDPSPTQVQTVPTEDERAPLKEHTNGVKPMSPASTVPNLFGSAVPNLAPNSGFGFSTSSDISPFKPIGPTSVTGQGKTGAQPSLFGNEENIPTSTASATQAPLQSLFAPKPTGAPVFGFGANNITSTAPTGGLFASVSAPAQTETENKSTSLFGNKEEPPKDNNAPKPGAPSLFSGFNTAPAAPATTQPSSLFSAKPTETQQPATNLFSNLGPVNGGLFNNVSSAAPATTPAVTAAPGVGLFGATTTAPTAPANTSNLFGASSAPTTTAEAPKSIFSFDTKPAAAPFTFGGATSKPSEPAPAPTSLFDNATATTTATAPSSVPSVFNISGVGSTGNSMSGSFPTTSTPFTFGAGTTAPALAATSMSLSFPPATPAGQPPAFSFGGFKVNNNSTTPTKSSDVQNRLSEDISMASPEQSPQKSDSPKTFSIFGSINNNLANRNTTTTAASFGAGANKPFTFGQPAAPSSLKFSESAKPPTLNFGPVMGSQPAASPAMPATSGITSLPGAASKFEFGGFTGIPGAPAATAAPSMPGASTAAPFTFNATGLDFSLQPTPGRKIATPRRKFPKR
ncbi:hypothetical protein BDZ91DRAFT_406003 [Kalaharituber pfeilii]|nr:hypothetical protein BDZ91DRAFT_406003 [Kalaharituber pfeilii]